jgi:predicted dehydrogenase
MAWIATCKVAGSEARLLKVAIIGCGKIADAHASQITRIQGCEIVGVCDRELLLAKQLFERFPVKAYFNDVAQLLTEARPDVVHITTPPQSHFELAMLCLDWGCHIYVEKPFTLYEDEARKIIARAQEKNLKVTVGHDAQFSPATRRMRTLVQSGYLGERVVQIESYYCYELGRAGYAAALLGDKNHWVRRLPGKLLQNVISHGVARIAEFLTTNSPQVMAYGFTSPLLRSLGEEELIDELRVIITEDDSTAGYFTFSSQMRPALHELRVYGTRNGLILDPDQETLIKVRGTRFKSYLEKFVPSLIFARQNLHNFSANLRAFMRNDFHMTSGMRFLIESFYDSIRRDSPVPIPYREILLTARLMDNIFAQLDRQLQTTRVD